MSRTARPIRIEGDVAYVPLTKGYTAIIDAADVPLVEGRFWQAEVSGKTVYAVRTDGDKGRKRRVYMHHVLCDVPFGLEVDHEDRIGLNNRRKNLRPATRVQNICNQGPRKDNVAGLKGVSWFGPASKWRARICLHGQSRFLGYFVTADEARAAYAAASSELHGKFAGGI